MATTRRGADSAAPTRWYATGRRKEASARVFLSEGTGQVIINGRPAIDYLHRTLLVNAALAPLHALERVDRYDIMATVSGGGITGQAGAIRHGLARALAESDAELRGPLKAAGYLRRDARAKERKKYGQRGARARFQFSKR